MNTLQRYGKAALAATLFSERRFSFCEQAHDGRRSAHNDLARALHVDTAGQLPAGVHPATVERMEHG